MPQGEEPIVTADEAGDSIVKHNCFLCGIITFVFAVVGFYSCKSMLLHVHPATTLATNATNSDAQGRL